MKRLGTESHPILISDEEEDPHKKRKVDDGHYTLIQGERIGSYRVKTLIGQGTFGKVAEAYNSVAKHKVALKVIKAIQKYRDAAETEFKVLMALNHPNCVKLIDRFTHRGHVCFAFELLGCSVFDYLKNERYIPFELVEIKELGQQLLSAVDYLHEQKIIHTDLKLENVSLVSDAVESCFYMGNQPYIKRKLIELKVGSRRKLKSLKIKVIDFGSAVFMKGRHHSLVSTRHYRAPEIVLGQGWSKEIDIWSIGCILVELYTGLVLFQTRTDPEHLALIEKILEVKVRLPESHHKSAKELFVEGRLAYPRVDTAEEKKAFLRKQRSLEELLVGSGEEFKDLVRRMLRIDPRERITARDALNHEFFDIN